MITKAGKGTMNPETTVPTYQVQITYPVQPNRNKSFTFRHADLLTARQGAFEKAQQVIAEKNPDDAVDISISLIEVDRASTSDKHPVLTTVVKQRFNRTSFMDGEIDLLAGMDRNSLAARSLHPSIFSTIGLKRSQEPGNCLGFSEKTLTVEESAYYQHQGHSISAFQ